MNNFSLSINSLPKLKKLQDHFDAGDRFGFVCTALRIGCSSLMAHLEYEHYCPNDVSLNDRFQIFIVFNQGIEICIVSIPLEDRHIAEAVAAKHGCRFVDDVPVILGGIEKVVFPIIHRHLCSVENVKDHPCYKPGYDNDIALKKENDELTVFFNEKHALYKASNKK